MVRATLKRLAKFSRKAGQEVAMAGVNGPDETGHAGQASGKGSPADGDLDKRRRELAAALSARKPAAEEGEGKSAAGGMAGFGYALRLSSEFIAGIVVGAGLGWIIDRVAGTSPWGLIVFLLLGFVAGVLNVLRSAGLMADFGAKTPGDERRD
jgi:ATP synthase protein I